MSRYVAKNMKSRQTAWNVATQQRISTTSAMVADLKHIKMLGLQTAIRERILEQREHELSRAKEVRWLNFGYNASGEYFTLPTGVCRSTTEPV